MNLDLPETVDLLKDLDLPRNLELPEVSDEAVSDLVRRIDRCGYAEIDGYLDGRTMEDMRGVVARAIERSGGQYVALTGAAPVAGTAMEGIARSAAFQHLMRRLYSLATGSVAPPIEFHQVLRCLCGTRMINHSYNFHYDSYLVTALIPVEIVPGGRGGDLIMLPNTRPLRKTYAANVLDKLLLDNRLTQFALRSLAKRNLLKLTRIKLVPGNLYLFWGYRSVHTNEPCDLDKLRATALYHYANPHVPPAVRSDAGPVRGWRRARA